MNARHHDLAEEFCKLVGAPNLLVYLGLTEETEPETAQAKLKDKRRYMQGMQNNPKHKEAALFLIKNFAALEAVLADPPGHVSEIARRAEAQHLPILEMTIQGVLKGGALSQEQEDFLRRNALELGISVATFEETLTRLAEASGVERPSARGSGLSSSSFPPMPRVVDEDLYELLGTYPEASTDRIYAAYERKLNETRSVIDPAEAARLVERYRRAWKILGDKRSRRSYDQSLRSTGPPAREREVTDPGFRRTLDKDPPLRNALAGAPRAPADAATAPPVRTRTHGPPGGPSSDPPPVPVGTLARGSLGMDPGRGPRLEILGEPIRNVHAGNSPVAAEIIVRNGGEGGMTGRIATDEPWIIAQPTRLDPNRTEQRIAVRISPRDMPDRQASGVVTIQTDQGERASVVFEVTRRASAFPLMLGGTLLAGSMLVAALLAWLLGGLTGGGGVNRAGGLTITVDPTAEEVLLDGELVGTGGSVFLPDPPVGTARITVKHPNFKVFSKEVDLEAETSKVIPVRLELDRVLDFRPTGDLKKAPLDQEVAQRVMAERSRAMDDCVRAGLARGKSGTLSGRVRIHVGKEGHAVGVEIEGEGSEDADVRRCLERQAAAVVLPQLEGGDYATVRYDYQVTEAPSP